MSWTAADVPDQTGRFAIVTGANSGIGLETTRELARNGATVLMACRDRDRAERAAEDVRRDVPDAELPIERLDLASLESVRSFADATAEYGSIDLLINNAGVMAISRQETDDGFETQFGVNHLGHFALTGLVFDRLAADGRIVTVASEAHRMGELDFEDLHGKDDYGKWSAYGQSKLANLLFAYELDRRLAAAGSEIKSIAVHPGYTDTNLQLRGPRQEGSTIMTALMRALNAIVGQAPADGALPTLYAATAPAAESGAYYGPDGVLKMRGLPERQRSSDASDDLETARRLWSISETQTGVEYDLSIG